MTETEEKEWPHLGGAGGDREREGKRKKDSVGG